MSVGEADQFCSTWSRSTTSTFKVAGTWGNWLEMDYQGRQAGYARNWLTWEEAVLGMYINYCGGGSLLLMVSRSGSSPVLPNAD